ncbi:DotU family type IV/VI secretion system protein [Cupriavidus consociatus]|uniref:DotU family type IV/VI secretion system protein n=1 Tax=Cupriavidus consociatus TaxID=2821357 RepID=UPI001FD72D22|nr:MULTISPECIES: DotU family type IV/VI secretion system protein [unclassified Cupriavidus]MDK2660313.1 DotU family type IV/VI secretion system protein [Cupriavidus sp. LEh21]
MTPTAMGSGNHLLRLAQPVIRVLDELTPELDSAARLETLQEAAHSRLASFRQACRAAALPAEDVEAVHYCLCAALDQAGRRVQGRSGACRGAWLRHGLLAAHYGEADRGGRCRALVARLQQRAGAHADALEVIAYLIGRGLTDESGRPPAGLVPPIRPTTQEIVALRPAPPWQAQPEALPQVPSFGARPLLAVASAVFLVAAVVVVQATRQNAATDALALRLARLERLPQAVFPSADTLERDIEQAFARQLASAAIRADVRSGRLHLVFQDGLSFPPGQAQLPPALAEQLDKLADLLDGRADWITVVGHADDSPMARGAYRSNQALSESRAAEVAGYLQARALVPVQIESIGRGAAQPAADNRTAKGRLLNRRVEVFAGIR